MPITPDSPEHDRLTHALTFYLTVDERRRVLAALRAHAERHELPATDRRRALLRALDLDPTGSPA